MYKVTNTHIPKGYIIDKSKSTFERIVFIKQLPKSQSIPKFSNTITGNLKRSLYELGLIFHGQVYSDKLKNDYYSIKIVGFYITKDEEIQLIKSMKDKGYSGYINVPPKPNCPYFYSHGTRFIFKKD